MDRRGQFLLFFLAIAAPSAFAWLLFKNPEPRQPPSLPLRAPAAAFSITASQHASSPDSPPLFSTGDENLLSELARSGAACPLLESKLVARAPLSSLYGLFFENPAARRGDALDAYLRALSARTNAELEGALRSASHPLLDLAEANLRLGLLPTLAGTRPDPHAAVAALRGLADSDPLNAAPSLLLAYALKLDGQPEESASELERALSRPLFRLYADEAIAALYRRAEARPALVGAALAIETRAPSPDLWPLEDFLVDALVDADQRTLELAYAFGRRQASERSASGSLAAALNFGFGQRIAATAWRRLHPKQAPPRVLAGRPTRSHEEALPGLRLPLAPAACERALPKLAARLGAKLQEP